MHIESAVISTGVASVMAVSQLGSFGYLWKEEKGKFTLDEVAKMGVAGAFIFAGQMFNFTIPTVGSSGHIVGAIFLCALLGKNKAFLTMSLLIALQAIGFHDGGLLALGCNIFNMAFIPCVLVYPIYIKVMEKKKEGNLRFVGLGVASVASLVLGAAAVVVEVALSGVVGGTVVEFTNYMLPIHIVIGVIEGVLTGSVLYLLESTHKWKERKWITLAIVAISLSVIAVLYASSLPDGLEWSLEKANIGGVATQDFIHLVTERIQSVIAIARGYQLGDNQSIWSRVFVGTFGTVLMFFSTLGFCLGKNNRQVEVR